MNKTLEPKQVLINNCTIYGKVLCTHCGSDTNLAHINMVTNDLKDQWETTLCIDCIKEIPSYHDLVDEESV